MIADEPIHTASKQSHRSPRIFVWKEDASLPAMFNPLCSSTNQQLFKKNFYNQIVATTDDLHKPLRAYHKIDTFRDEQRWMVHKGGPW